ncbi:MAG: hypothetical protein OHK0022_27830 [Roseiflexaceae bacterium]
MTQQQQDIHEEIGRELELLRLLRDRQYERDKQAAIYGIDAEPAINTEREDLAAEIKRREKRIAELQAQTAQLSEDEAMTAVPAAQQPAQQPLREVVSDLARRVQTIEQRSEADGRALARLETAVYALIGLGVLNLALGLAGLILTLATR